jgi:hypothetical protein
VAYKEWMSIARSTHRIYGILVQKRDKSFLGREGYNIKVASTEVMTEKLD